MSRIASPKIRNQIRERANQRCEYCRLPDSVVASQFQVDHIIPTRHLGTDELENLAWTCIQCNNHKGTDIGTVDYLTMQRAWLFHPRYDKWDAHLKLIHKAYY